MAEKIKNVELVLKNVRLSFLHVFEPQVQVNEKTGKDSYSYSATALIPKKLADGTVNPQIKVIQEAMRTAQEGTWAGQSKSIPPDRRCFRDGEPIDPDTVDPDVPGSGARRALYDGYAGHMFLAAKRSIKNPAAPNPVQLLGPKKTAKDSQGRPCFPRLTEADGLLYSGAYADLIVRIYGYDGKKDGNPDRINASLEAIKFVRHGEAFGAKAVDADSMFDEEADDGFASDDDDII